MAKKKKRRKIAEPIIKEKPVLTKEGIKKKIIEKLHRDYKLLEPLKMQPLLENFTRERIIRSVFEYHQVTQEENALFNKAINELKKENMISEHMKILWIYPLKGKEPPGYDYSTILIWSYAGILAILLALFFIQQITERDFIIGIGALVLSNLISLIIAILLEYKKGIQTTLSHIINHSSKIIGFLLIAYMVHVGFGFDLPSSLSVGGFIGLFIPTWDKILIK